MKKLKLKTLSNWMEKTEIRVGDKVIKLREERQLLGRFLIIQGSRPGACLDIVNIKRLQNNQQCVPPA